MDVYNKIAVKIIQSQEAIIGPVAIEQARQVPHLRLDWDHNRALIDGNAANVINQLVEVYKELFGQISVEVSKEAVAKLVGDIPAEKLPEALK